MRIRWSAVLRWACLTSWPIIICAFALLFLELPSRTPSDLESRIVRVPLGIRIPNAESLMGRSPDEVSFVTGCLATPVTLLAQDNELAKNYGPPQTYVLRIWRDNGVSATIAAALDGTVAGRWSWTQ